MSAVFEEQAKFDLHDNIQLLADIRDCFAYHGYPNRLSTSDLLDWIHSLPARPWNIDGRFSAHTLARLLEPFDIHPRMQRMDTAKANGKSKGKDEGKDNYGLRGYQLQAFQEPWKEHLDFEVPQSEIEPFCGRPSPQAKSLSEAKDLSEAVCCGVSLTHARVAQRGKPQKNTTGPQPPPAAFCPDLSLNCRETETISNIVDPPGSPTHAGVACDRAEVPSVVSDGRWAPSPVAVAARENHPEVHTDQTPASEIADPGHSTSSTQSTHSAVTQLPEPNLAGFYRLTHLHQRLRLQGLCPPLDILANMYSYESLKAALDWVDAHPEWSVQFKYKPAMEFIAAFQNGPVRLYLHDKK